MNIDKLENTIGIGDKVAFPIISKGRFFTKAVLETGEIVQISPSGRTVVRSYFGDTVCDQSNLVKI